MLTSSDAKWRCMWHMLVWSIMLTLVSQFLALVDHIAFYIFACPSVLVLPIITAVYSNTGGKKGAGLLRASYVFCDPVLACLTISPVLLLNHLPVLVDEYTCLRRHFSMPNLSLNCFNLTDGAISLSSDGPLRVYELERMISERKMRFLLIQISLLIPIVLVLMMGKRTRKMNISTFLLVTSYWLMTGIEAADLMEASLLGNKYKHIIYTTEAIISIVMILTNSYAVVTLCSYVTPGSQDDSKRQNRRYDFLYKVFVGVAAIFFAEIPFLVARFQILAADIYAFLPGTFYLWLVKDVVFIGMIIVLIVIQKFGSHIKKISCKPAFDTPNVNFQPEKRDRYIYQQNKKVRFQEPVATAIIEQSKSGTTGSIYKKPSKGVLVRNTRLSYNVNDRNSTKAEETRDSRVVANTSSSDIELTNRTAPSKLIRLSNASDSDTDTPVESDQLLAVEGAPLKQTDDQQYSSLPVKSPLKAEVLESSRENPAQTGSSGARPKLVSKRMKFHVEEDD